MSETIRFDRKKGFVALPVEVLELDLSPGAFRLLVELCRMANLDGFCWPSLGQLGERLGRSKAAISGYVTALRDAELITTETQTTANGYNYRLRYCVVFWKDWRASLTGKVVTKDECSVRPDERHRNSKNQNQINHEQCELDDYEKLTKVWADCAKGAPYPALKRRPDADVITRTADLLSKKAAMRTLISADIIPILEALWSDLNLAPDPEMSAKIAQHLSERGLAESDLRILCQQIKQLWQPHWRKYPTLKQVDQMVKTASIVPVQARIRLLEGYMRRYALMQKTLRRSAPCERLPGIDGAPAPSPSYIRGYN